MANFMTKGTIETIDMNITTPAPVVNIGDYWQGAQTPLDSVTVAPVSGKVSPPKIPTIGNVWSKLTGSSSLVDTSGVGSPVKKESWLWWLFLGLIPIFYKLIIKNSSSSKYRK